MPKMLQQCQKCTQYTLQQTMCPHCGSLVKTAHPPKFSPEDKYGKYRRVWKKKKTLQKLKGYSLQDKPLDRSAPNH